MPIILGPSPPPGPGEGLIWSGTDLNDGTSYSLRAVDFTPPPKRPEWVQGADADGSALVRDPLFDNRVVTVTLRVGPTGGLTMDAALAKVGALIDLCEESEKQQDGTALVWTPSQGTKAVTLYVLSAEISELPVEKDSQASGWFRKAPTVTLKLTCKPFGYGTEVTVGASTASTPFIAYTVAGVTGDVPAEARLIVTDAATQTRHHLEWGLQQRYYDAATSLQVNSASLVTSGFIGTSTTRAGSFNTNVIRGSLIGSVPLALCGLGDLAHVGTYRVKARVYSVISSGATMNVRLTWKEGDGSLSANAYAIPPAGTANWSEVDLGLISIPEKTLGTQRWTGQIEAYSTSTGDTLDIDYLLLIPADVYGKARAPVMPLSGASVSASDVFNQTAGALNAKTATQGGNWATAGAATGDLQVDATNHIVTRGIAEVGFPDVFIGRGATLPVALAATFAQIDFSTSGGGDPGVAMGRGALQARYIDENNWLMGQLAVRGYGGSGVNAGQVLPIIQVRVGGGGFITIANPGAIGTVAAGAWLTMKLTVDGAGNIALYWGLRGGALTLAASGSHASLATGGALASGAVGFRDAGTPEGGLTPTRNYDNFVAGPTSAAGVVINSTRSAEINSQKADRIDSTGTFWGPVPSYRGGRFLLPEAGSQNRTSRLFVKARRNDVDALPDDQVADSTTVQVKYTPRFLAIPR